MKNKPKIDLKNLTYDEILHFTKSLGLAKYRTRQIFEWVFKHGVTSVNEMTNLSGALREKLAGIVVIGNIKTVTSLSSRDGDTVKYLFELQDGERIESVWMRYSYGRTVCVSTQVGCRMGCVFCASTHGGLMRNLEPGEIYDQVLKVQKNQGESITHIVIMGMGEPLENYDNTLTFIKNINSEYGLNISARRITLSTCGMVPKIRELAGLKLQLTLAVSLHAPNNALRSRLMPINRRYPLEELLPACRDYVEATGRRITFEYALMQEVNDFPELAYQLAELLDDMKCHVNLIPANPVRECGFERSSTERVAGFKRILEKKGIAVTVRRELGADINQVSEAGLIRENNEDCFCINDKLGLFAVAAGMGGHRAGEVASQLAVKTLQESLGKNLLLFNDPLKALSEAVRDANREVYRIAYTTKNCRGMGTTLTACLIHDEKRAAVAHVGDSRAYLIRNNGIYRLTEDHSLVQEMVNAGGITEEQAFYHPQRNILVRALGTAAEVGVDVTGQDIIEGDILLLCTDGLTSHLRDEEILSIAVAAVDPDSRVKDLLLETFKRGATDNVTIISIEF